MILWKARVMRYNKYGHATGIGIYCMHVVENQLRRKQYFLLLRPCVRVICKDHDIHFYASIILPAIYGCSHEIN